MSSENENRLFDSSDESCEEDEKLDVLNVENNYAKKYNDWRRKEELQKLKDKYGDNLDIMSEIENDSGSGSDDEGSDEESDSSDSLSDDQFDEQFLKVYSALKCKDPEIYDKSFNVVKDNAEDNSANKSKKIKQDKSEKFTLQQYHKKLIEEKKGITEEDESMLHRQLDDESEEKPNGYYEELYNIRREIKDIVNQGNEEEGESDNDQFFSVKGNNQSIGNKSKPISSQKETEQMISKIWHNKQLDKGDDFLKDYIVNKRYLNESQLSSVKKLNQVENRFGGFDNEEDGEDDSYLTDSDEEREETGQSQVEIANYHFEEPDANVIKRYPRSIGSIRDTINKDKKSHRAEVREKKKKEKESELKRLRKLKREETESKIKKLKKISGNQNIDIKDLDLNVIIDDENEFDLEKYDQKMQLLFGDSYYNTDMDESNKPSFDYIPEIDDDLYGDQSNEHDIDIKDGGKKATKKKNKKEIKQKKDIMADDDIGIYEDLIGGDIATRFKYRMVEPNDFGLTDEEILRADDTELNRWCSLKKMSQFRSNEEEAYDKKVYLNKTKNLDLKKKIFQSIYGDKSQSEDNNQHQEDEAEINHVDDKVELTKNEDVSQKTKKKGKKRRNKKVANKTSQMSQKKNCTNPDEAEVGKNVAKKQRKRKRNSAQISKKDNQGETISDVTVQRLKAYGMSNREIKRMKLNK